MHDCSTSTILLHRILLEPHQRFIPVPLDGLLSHEKTASLFMILQDLHHKFVAHYTENLPCPCALPKGKHAKSPNVVQA